MNTPKSIIHDFEVYCDDFHHNEENKMITNSFGWNGRELKIIPIYELIKRDIIPNNDLCKLKPFDIIKFEDNRCYDSYLIVPYKVKNKCNIELENINNDLKLFALGYGLIKFEFDPTDEIAFIPPEGLEMIEKYDEHYFDIIKEMENVEGIIVDHYYIKKNKETLKSEWELIGDPRDFHKIGFLWITKKYILALNDASNEQIKQKSKLIFHYNSKSEKDFIDIDELINININPLNLPRPNPYLNLCNIYEDIEKKSKPVNVNLKSKKKDELIEIIHDKNDRINSLEKKISNLNIELEKITNQYKDIKAKNSENQKDSRFLNNNVSNSVINMKLLMSKIENELNKISN